MTRSSPYALMWQWSGGGGVRNAIGDFDQIDASGLPQDRPGTRTAAFGQWS